MNRRLAAMAGMAALAVSFAVTALAGQAAAPPAPAPPLSAPVPPPLSPSQAQPPSQARPTAETPSPRAWPPSWPTSPAAFDASVSAHTDALLLPAAHRPPPRPLVTAATRVDATAQAVAAVFLDPAVLRQALPAVIRADVVQTRPGRHPEGWPDRLLAWEVEVPLFNLSGKAWLQQHADGTTADLTLVDGAFAPGRIRFRVATSPTGDGGAGGVRGSGGGATILSCDLQVEVRSTNWIFRKVVRHDPWAETAMSAAMSWVVARAVALRAEAPPGVAPARPRAAIQPPVATALDGSALAQAPLAALRAAGTLASVRRAPTGRLAWSSVAVTLRGGDKSVASRLATPETWVAFPGWKSVVRERAAVAVATATATAPGPTSPPSAPSGATTTIVVEDDVSLVDLDARWLVDLKPPGRATAIGGDIRGAVLAWQTFTDRGVGRAGGDGAPGTTLAVLSMHPRLDASGFVARRLVAAEPLLEHALAVALTYVDAAAIAAAFNGHSER